MKKSNHKKTIAQIQIILGIIFLLTSLIGTYYINSDYYFSEKYDNEGNPKGLLASTFSDFLSTYGEYSEVEFDKYLNSIGYTTEEYDALSNNLKDSIDEDYSTFQGKRHTAEVVGTILMFSFIAKSFTITYFILGFISSIISIMLILTGFYNYHK